MRRLVIALLVLPTAALAHAHLRSAQPPVGGTVKAPSQVEITFSEGVEPRFSSIKVTNAAGQEVDRSDPHTLGNADRLAVSLKPVGPGAYHVVWHATAVDTHKTEGSFDFTVVP